MWIFIAGMFVGVIAALLSNWFMQNSKVSLPTKSENDTKACDELAADLVSAWQRTRPKIKAEVLRLRSELTAARDEIENLKSGQIKTDNSQALVNALAEIERLRGRVAVIESAARQVVRAAPNSGPLWFQSEEINALCEAVKGNGEAWLLRKQAEAVEAIRPTAEMKAEMLGSFKITEELTCSACYFDEPDNDCEVCAGDVTYAQDFQIPWTSQKQIIGTAVEHVAQRLNSQSDAIEKGERDDQN